LHSRPDRFPRDLPQRVRRRGNAKAQHPRRRAGVDRSRRRHTPDPVASAPHEIDQKHLRAGLHPRHPLGRQRTAIRRGRRTGTRADGIRGSVFTSDAIAAAANAAVCMGWMPDEKEFSTGRCACAAEGVLSGPARGARSRTGCDGVARTPTTSEAPAVVSHIPAQTTVTAVRPRNACVAASTRRLSLRVAIDVIQDYEALIALVGEYAPPAPSRDMRSIVSSLELTDPRAANH